MNEEVRNQAGKSPFAFGRQPLKRRMVWDHLPILRRLLARSRDALPSVVNVVTKPKRTRRELADIIAERVNVADSMILVQPNKQLGWRAVVLTAPIAAIRAQETVDRIAEELRTQFDLAE